MKQKPMHAAMQPFLEGRLLLIDKPLYWTSFDAVKKIRILTGVSKVGHAGTLDPLATGLLVICTGRLTKSIPGYVGLDKEYAGTMTVGATTPTYDLESSPDNFANIDNLSEQEIRGLTERFRGQLFQVPPICKRTSLIHI